MAYQDNNELRKFKRRHLIYYLEVFDDESGELLGYLVDLNINGLKLVSKTEIPSGKDFRLRMTMPEEYCKDQQVIFSARSMWCSKDVNPDFYAAGFSAPDLNQEIRRLFMVMIDQVGFND